MQVRFILKEAYSDQERLNHVGINFFQTLESRMCAGSPFLIEESVPLGAASGSGQHVGASIIYACNGHYIWSDGTSRAKTSTCMGDQLWTPMYSTCRSLPDSFL